MRCSKLNDPMSPVILSPTSTGVKEEREAAGFDREAYEHSLTLKNVLKSQGTVFHDADRHRWAIFRLGGLLGSKEKVKEIAELEKLPKVTKGMSELDFAEFVWVDDEARDKIKNWMDLQRVVAKSKEGEVSKDS